jgi:hypothetical protein
MEPHKRRLSSMLQQRKTENPLGASKNGGRTGKVTCKYVELEENEKITKKACAGRGHESKWEIPIDTQGNVR